MNRPAHRPGSRTRHSGRRQHGLSLVELMVAMTVGLFLTAGILSLFIGTKQSYRTNEALAVVQEDGRYQLERLATDLRQAGSLGCQRTLKLQEELPDAGTTDRLMHDRLSIKNTLELTDDDNDPGTATEALYWWLYNFSEQPPVEGFAGTGTGFETDRDLPGGLTESALFGELNLDEAIDEYDVIVTRRAAGPGIPIIKHGENDDDTPEDAPLIIPSSANISVGDIAIASTCEYATVFQVTDITEDLPCSGLSTIQHEIVTDCDTDADGNAAFTCPDPVNKGASLGFRYANDVDFASSCPTTSELEQAIDDTIGTLYRAQVGIYHVRNNPEGIPTIYFKDNLGNSQQLITGVYGLQAQFGLNGRAASCDSSGNAPDLEAYYEANNAEIGNWAEVNAIKLSLLLGSSDEGLANVVEEPLSLAFPGAGDDGVFAAGDLSDADDRRRLYQVFTSKVFLRNKLPCLRRDQWNPASGS